MSSLFTLAQALGVSYMAGVNLYATVAITGFAERMGWIPPLPGALSAMTSPWVIVLAALLYLFEFGATLIPGVASAWETFHSLIRPPAAAGLAVLTAWNGDARFVVLAALLGGGLALTTHATKLGLRYAVDTSPEPVSNGAVNVAELGLVATLAFTVWNHPYLSLAVALVLLVLLAFTVRAIWRALARVFSGKWMPGCGLLQHARADSAMPSSVDQD